MTAPRPVSTVMRSAALELLVAAARLSLCSASMGEAEKPSRDSDPDGARGVRLIRPGSFPDRIAITKTGSFVDGGLFFLDFTRPAQFCRRFGRINSHVGMLVDLVVPVIHGSEEHSSFRVWVDPRDPHFQNLRALWQAHYPAEACVADGAADPARCVADFFSHFSHDAPPSPTPHPVKTRMTSA